MADLEKKKSKWEKQKAIWEKHKAKGKVRFVVFWETVFIIESILLSTFECILDNSNAPISVRTIIFVYLLDFIVFGLLGYYVSCKTWNTNMKKFG